MSVDPRITLEKPLVLIGLMGAGKSTVGRRLADRLSLPFIDSDDEIALAADLSIPEIFEKFGEHYFRDGEERVIERLIGGPVSVLSTGGGAFMSEKTRDIIKKKGISIWLRADIETLWERVAGKPGRPLLLQENPKQTLNALLEARYPLYRQADIVVDSIMGNPHEAVIDDIISALKRKPRDGHKNLIR